MAKRSNHYEAAFEAFLRDRQLAYVAVDEKKRALLFDGSIKSLDFIVSPSSETSLLIDVKGRQFPSGRQKRYWKNWSTRDDTISLTRWQQLFGNSFQSMFVFAYEITSDRSPVPEDQLFTFRERRYGFVGILLEHYLAHAKRISTAWDTIAMPTATFRQFARPVDFFLNEQCCAM